MKSIFTIFIAILMSTTGGLAQNGTIIGTVVDANDEPLEFVAVSLEGTTKGVNTNAAGEYRIEDVTPGQYTLSISMMGYELKIVRVRVQAGQEKKVASQTLENEGQDLDEVTVRGRKSGYVQNKVSPSLRQQTEIAKLPQNIQVISSDLLRDQQVTSMMDGVTRNVSGVTMLEHWGNFARINMRGFRLPAFRNGFNVNDSWGPLSEDMSLVEQIEFVKGPAGFMLAAGEPGGFYNVVTKKPPATPIGQATIMAGSFDFYRASVDLGGKATKDGKLLYRFNAMYQTADSHRGNEDTERFAIAPALTYQVSDKTTVTAELNYQQAESFLGAAYVFAPVSVGYGGLDRNFKFTDNTFPVSDITEVMAFANVNHRFSDQWSVTVQAGHLNYEQTGASGWNGGVEENGDILRRVSIWDALSLGNYGQVFVNGKFNTGEISHT